MRLMVAKLSRVSTATIAASSVRQEAIRRYRNRGMVLLDSEPSRVVTARLPKEMGRGQPPASLRSLRSGAEAPIVLSGTWGEWG